MPEYPVFTIDREDVDPMLSFRLTKDLHERIIEAQNLALMNEISANAVVINGQKYGMLKDTPGFVPTIFGMKAETKVNMPDEWDFLLQERPPKPKSNADKIRAMSDEELAKELKGIGCPGICRTKYREDDIEQCYKCWLDWLRREVDNG